jgi:hypothetical protein
MKEADSLNDPMWKLREASAELQALSHLFRLKRQDEAPPLDMEEINWGISRILDRLAKRVRRAARQIEKVDLNRHAQKRSG